MNLRRSALLLLAPAALAVGLLAPPAPAQTTTLPHATTRNHFIANLEGAAAAPHKVGFTIFDTGASLSQVRALPRGVKSLAWLGQKCPTRADTAFRRTVTRLSKSPRVFGYYLADEPHVSDCPGGAAGLASRAAFIRRASGGAQRSFITLSEPADYKAFRPAVTHVSMFGLDPYPCSVAHPTCEFRQINEAVTQSTARGIPLGRIVPVYQAFGQGRTADHYYNLPSAAQMSTMIARWAKLVPHPPMDYAYGWAHQGSANPTLVDSAGLKRTFTNYFAG
jgi:hypothetical protein